MLIKSTTTYVNGILTPAVSATVNDTKDIVSFIKQPFETLGLPNKRVKMPVSLFTAENRSILESAGFFPVYYHYTLNLETCGGKLHPEMKEQSFADIISFAEYIRPLIHECATRMPCEFDMNGEDPSWFFLGKKLFTLTDEVTGEMKGFRSVEQVSKDTMKLWMAYVNPSFRRQGVYTALLEHIKAYAKNLGITYLSVATDVTEANPMHNILKSHGFEISTITYRN